MKKFKFKFILLLVFIGILAITTYVCSLQFRDEQSVKTWNCCYLEYFENEEYDSIPIAAAWLIDVDKNGIYELFFSHDLISPRVILTCIDGKAIELPTPWNASLGGSVYLIDGVNSILIEERGTTTGTASYVHYILYSIGESGFIKQFDVMRDSDNKYYINNAKVAEHDYLLFIEENISVLKLMELQHKNVMFSSKEELLSALER